MSGSDKPQYIADDYGAIARAMKDNNEPVPSLQTRPGFVTDVRTVGPDGRTIYYWNSDIQRYRGWYAIRGQEEKGGPYNTDYEARDAALGEEKG